MSADHIPSLSSRRLGRALQTLRQERNISCDEAAAATGHDPIWLVQIEVGQAPITIEDLRPLLDLYGVADEHTRRHLTDLLRLTGGPAWLKEHAGWLSELERDLIALESEASGIRALGIPLIPDLLRTEDYARTILTAIRLPGTSATIDQQVDLVLNRQRQPDATTPRRLHVVLDEASVVRPVGGPGTMRGQLRHLLDQAARDDTVLQLIPREVGAHPGLDGAFDILDFADPAEPSVSISHSVLGRLLSYVDLNDHFEELRRIALSPSETVFMIGQALDDL